MSRIATELQTPLSFADLSEEQLSQAFGRAMKEVFKEGLETEMTWTSQTWSQTWSQMLVLLWSPVAILRNVLALLLEAPFSPFSALFLVLLLLPIALLSQLELSEAGSTTVAANVASLLLLLPMLVFWRVLFRAIIQERDIHMAERVRAACTGRGMHGWSSLQHSANPLQHTCIYIYIWNL